MIRSGSIASCLLIALALGASAQPQPYRLPLHFEPLQGVDAFVSRTSGYTLRVDAAGARFTPRGAERPMEMVIEGARAHATGQGVEPTGGISNYFLGADPAHWRTKVPHFAKVKFTGVYPDIDLVYYDNQQQLEYDFIVNPGGDPASIRLAWKGVEDLRLDRQGQLLLSTNGVTFRQLPPRIFQDIDGHRIDVAGRYQLLPDRRVTFALSHYDRTRPLVIDPVMSYATYIGGAAFEEALAVAVDSQGNAYIAGRTNSEDFRRGTPTLSPQYLIRPPSSLMEEDKYDAFITKINAAGTGILYSTYIGGKGFDVANAIAVDSAGNMYIAGATSSNGPAGSSFPIAGTGAVASNAGNRDGFLAKLDPTGSQLLFSTYLGTPNHDAVKAIALSGARLFVTGAWNCTQPDQSCDIFAARYATTGGTREAFYTSNATGNDIGTGIAADSLGNVYISATVESLIPQTAGYHAGKDAFVAGFSSNLNLQTHAYIGGTADDSANGIALSPAGEIYVTGSTTSTGLGNNLYGRNGLGSDAYIARLSASGSLTHFAYFGGTERDEALSIAVDANGTAYVAGFSESGNFPVSPFAAQRTRGGGPDAFIIRAVPLPGDSRWNLLFSSYFGGLADEYANAVAVSPAGVFIAGSANAGLDNSVLFPPSSTQPILTPAFGGGAADAWVARLANAPVDFNLSTTFGPLAAGVRTPARADGSSYRIIRGLNMINRGTLTANSCGANSGNGGTGIAGLSTCPNCTDLGAGQSLVSISSEIASTAQACTDQPAKTGCATNDEQRNNNDATFRCPSINPLACTPSFLTSTLQVDNSSREVEVTVEIPAGCSWNIASEANSFVQVLSPITASDSALAVGRTAVRLRILPNLTGQPRSTRVVATSVIAGELRIEQSASFGAVTSLLYANPAAVRFVAPIGGTAPAAVTLTLTADTATTVQASASAPWLTVTPSGATTPATFQISANAAGLAAGVYQAQVNFNSLQVPVTLAVFSPGTTSQIYSDVPATHTWIDYIYLLNRFGITVGCRDNPPAYCPGETVTQAQMAAFVIRAMLGESFSYSPTPYFTDLPASNSLFKYVQKMRELNINSGCGGGLFCPNATVTRGQMAAYVARALFGESFTYPTNQRFADIQPGEELFKYAQKIWSLGVTQGCSANQYCPADPVNREQMSAFLNRAFFGYARLTPNP